MIHPRRYNILGYRMQRDKALTKKRALRYVAAAEQEWLHPENHLPSTHWSKFGRGLLFMPEPRGICMGGEILLGYKGGGAESWNEYGHRPWEKGYKDDKRDAEESKTLTVPGRVGGDTRTGVSRHVVSIRSRGEGSIRHAGRVPPARFGTRPQVQKWASCDPIGGQSAQRNRFPGSLHARSAVAPHSHSGRTDLQARTRAPPCSGSIKNIPPPEKYSSLPRGHPA
jgi:hypothetical protein